jgi:hypothetical protein
VESIQLPPAPPTPTINFEPGVTGSVAVTDAPSPPELMQDPPPAPIAVTVILATFVGTANE